MQGVKGMKGLQGLQVQTVLCVVYVSSMIKYREVQSFFVCISIGLFKIQPCDKFGFPDI